MTDWQRALVRLLPAVAAIGAMIPATLAAGGATPEGQPLLPDLDQEMPTELILTKAGKHGHTSWRLGFRSAVRNIGDGPLIIDGRRPGRRPEDDGRRAGGRARPARRKTVVPGVGQLRYVRSPDHQHWHLLGFDRYELRRAGSTGAVVSDRKTGFCLGDRYEVTTRDLPAKAPDEGLPEPLRARAADADRDPRGHLGRLRRRLQREPRGPVPPARRPAPRALRARARGERRPPARRDVTTTTTRRRRCCACAGAGACRWSTCSRSAPPARSAPPHADDRRSRCGRARSRPRGRAGPRPARRDRRDGARDPVGDRVPARRPRARDRAAGARPPAHAQRPAASGPSPACP